MEKAEPDLIAIEAIMVKLPKCLPLKPCIVLHLEVDRQYRHSSIDSMTFSWMM